MNTYEYECPVCQHRFEAKQSIKDAPLKHCHCCGQYKLERVISGGIGSFHKGETKTLGQYAERTIKKMGKYHVEDKRLEHQDKQLSQINDKRRAASKKFGKDIELVKEIDTEKTKKINKINAMTPEQKQNYIWNG